MMVFEFDDGLVQDARYDTVGEWAEACDPEGWHR
jgi:hypothetical protein